MEASRHWKHDVEMISAARGGDEQELVTLLNAAATPQGISR